jgi:hypothetical protein
MEVALLIALFVVVYTIAERTSPKIPTEDSTPRDLNRRRASHAAAALNLSRAVRRMH